MQALVSDDPSLDLSLCDAAALCLEGRSREDIRNDFEAVIGRPIGEGDDEEEEVTIAAPGVRPLPPVRPPTSPRLSRRQQKPLLESVLRFSLTPIGF